MAWSLVGRGRGGRRMGPAQAEMAQEILRSIFAGKRSDTAREEWVCGCKASNWCSRATCRQCGSPRKQAAPPRSASHGKRQGKSEAPLPAHPAPAAAKPGGTKTDVAAAAVAAVVPATEARRLAPEDAKASAAAKALLLESSAQALREVGLTEQAATLEKDAAEQRRLADAAGPPPGKRMDLMEAFLRRSEGRLLKAQEKEKEAEKALSDATAARAAVEKELSEGRAKLQALRADLAAPDADAMEDAAAEGAEGIASLRAQLAVALRERDEARVAAPTLSSPSAGAVPPGTFEELQQKLAEAQEAYQDALKADRDDEMQSKVRTLADLTGQLIEAKRRRTT